VGQLYRSQAKAHHLLKQIDLGGPDSKLKQAGQIIFESFGVPATPITGVDLRDDLTVSLLQAAAVVLIVSRVGPSAQETRESDSRQRGRRAFSAARVMVPAGSGERRLFLAEVEARCAFHRALISTPSKFQ
jgi:hypothetical protein